RDFEQSCREAAAELKKHNVQSIVTVGSGPYPEYGVGWEAGYIASFLSGARVVAQAESLPPTSSSEALFEDLSKLAPDAVLVWSNPQADNSQAIISGGLTRYPGAWTVRIHDPQLGPVGTILYLGR